MTDIQVIIPEGAHDALDYNLVLLTQQIGKLDPERVAHGCLGGEDGYGAHWESDVFVMRPYYWGDCDCGWDELERDWSDAHKHADDCYLTESRRRIEASPLQAERAAALDARDRFKWGSAPNDAAQKRVDEVCDRLHAYEDSVYRELCQRHGIPWNKGLGCAVHCTCDHDRDWRAFYERHGGHKPTCALELPNFLHKRTGLEVRWYKWIGRSMEGKNVPADLLVMNDIFRECIASLNPQSSQGSV